MRRLLAALLFLAAAESAALACSCIMPPPPAQAGQMARETLRHALAIVEADILTSYDLRRGMGERIRVRRLLWGRAPQALTLGRGGLPSSAACDIAFRAGERRVIILYAVNMATRPAMLGPHISCADYLTRPEYLPVLLRGARRLRR